MDWMIRLPEGLEEAFRQEVYAFEEAKGMPYITSVARAGIEKSRAEGMQQGEAAVLLRQLERNFGREAAAACRERVERADPDTLLEWPERILTTRTLDEVIH